MRVYLVRHGETDFNVQRRMQGHSEAPLNDRGIAQAASLGRRLAATPLDAIVASDLRRAAMTAAIIGAHTGAPIRYDAAFRERDPGIHLTGKSYDETQSFFTDWDYQPPGGETFTKFCERVKTAFDGLARVESLRDKHIAVVTHGMVCGAFMRVYFDKTQDEIFALRWPNASLTIIEHNGQWQVETIGDASHLDGFLSAAPATHSATSTGA